MGLDVVKVSRTILDNQETRQNTFNFNCPNGHCNPVDGTINNMCYLPSFEKHSRTTFLEWATFGGRGVKVREDKSAYLPLSRRPTAFTGVVWTKIIHCIVHHQIHGSP